MNPPQVAGVALALFGLTEFCLRRGQTARSIKLTADDRGTTPLIFASYAAVVCVLFFPDLPGKLFPPSIAWSGVAASFAGLAVRWWAMLVLGRFYTRVLVTTSEQTVVTRGPYRFVRHPGYLGSLLTWLGAAVATGNGIVVVFVSVLLSFVYSRRIKAEETMLVSSLGPAYQDYQRKSWRLVPLIF